jgi:hypothetical protein
MRTAVNKRKNAVAATRQQHTGSSRSDSVNKPDPTAPALKIGPLGQAAQRRRYRSDNTHPDQVCGRGPPHPPTETRVADLVPLRSPFRTAPFHIKPPSHIEGLSL